MAKCLWCGKDIPRGQRYKSPTLSSKPWCSEDCYLAYVQEQESKPKPKTKTEPKPKYPYLKELKDYITTLYPPDTISWEVVTKFIKDAITRYDLDCYRMRNILLFAINYCDHQVNEQYGLGQFFPRYIEPYQRFRDTILANRKAAMDLEDEDEAIEISLPQQVDRTKYRER